MKQVREKELLTMSRQTSRRINRVPRVINKDITLYLKDVDGYSDNIKHIQKFV